MDHLDPLSAKIVGLATALDAAGIDYAFGNPIALSYFAQPQGTFDIDLNILTSSEEPDEALRVLGGLNPAFVAPNVADEIRRTGQARVTWDGVLVDLFFQNLPFLEAAAKRTKKVPFADIQIQVLSPEDLVVCKAMFNRRKDWVAIEQLLYVQGDAFDLPYARNWLIEMVGIDDKRVRELDLLATQVAEWERSRQA